MLGTPFTHDMIRKYVVAFGTMFNNIKLQRIEDGADTQWISVPLSYAPKEKWHARLTDPRITQQIAISLPRISYELVTATYAPERKMNTMNKHSAVHATDQNKMKTMFAPVPYDLQFSLYIYSRNAADASNIIEQILPFFTPEFTVTLNDATDMNIDIDCPIILNSVNREDTYEGDFESRRIVTWSLDFTMKGLLFGPVRETGLIKKAYVDFFIPGGQNILTGYATSLNATATTNYIPSGLTYWEKTKGSYTLNTGAGTDTGTLHYISAGVDGQPAGTAAVEFSTDYPSYSGGSRSLKTTVPGIVGMINDIVWTSLVFANTEVSAGNSTLSENQFNGYGVSIPAGKIWLLSWYSREFQSGSGTALGETVGCITKNTEEAHSTENIKVTHTATDEHKEFPSDHTTPMAQEGWLRQGIIMDFNTTLNSTSRAGAPDGYVNNSGDHRTHNSMILTFEIPLRSIHSGSSRTYYIDGLLLEDVTSALGPDPLTAGPDTWFDTLIAADYPSELSTLPNRIKLASDASAIEQYYKNAKIEIIAGLGTGDTATITSYDGDSRIATFVPIFQSQPDSTTKYRITYNITEDNDSLVNKSTPTASRIYTQPGLTVEGYPTSNGLGSGTPADNPLYSTLSVDVAEIDANDDFGIIQTQTFFPSNTALMGTRRNLSTGDDE